MQYVCGQCEAGDCKLWRPSHVFADAVYLTCWKCLEAAGHTVALHAERHTDQVYDPRISGVNYVPAIPTLDEQWWGYTSVPSWWVDWWHSLPDTRDDCTYCKGTKKLAEFDCMFCKGTGLRAAERAESA